MQTITVERTIAAPIDDVFDWCLDTSNWQSSGWVLRNRLERSGTTEPWGRDAVRTHLWLIGWFRERVTASDRPHSMSYLVIKSFPPSRHDGGSMTFTTVPGGTKVSWETTGEVPIPLIGGPVTRLVMRPVTTLVFDRILRRCDRDLRSGS